MKRAVICVENPELHITQYQDYSIMVINPGTPPQRLKYLLDNSDYSLLITDTEISQRNGGDYNEAALWYTSGTTGDSKFYSFSQQQLDHLANTICQEYKITGNDRYLSIMPLWHAHGLGLYWAAKKAACEVKYIKLAELKSSIDYSPTIVSAIPDFLRLLTKQTFPELRFVRSASSALPTKLYNDLVAWSGKPVIEAFGMTEACSHCFTNPLHGEQRIGTVGLPSGIEAEIRDKHLWIKGPAVFKAGWIDTGDLAETDDYGYYRIVGRSVDRIIVRGYKIDPLSIENQLYSALPDINEISVFGKDKIMCVYTGNVSEGQVRKTLIDINPMCNPKFLKHLDSIPTNNAGKISRTMLTEMYR